MFGSLNKHIISHNYFCYNYFIVLHKILRFEALPILIL